MSLHVCHLAKYYPPAAGGIETHVQALARGQQALGLRVTVLVVNHRDASGREVFDRRWSSTPACIDSDEGIRIIRAARKCSISKWDYCPRLPRLIRELQTGPDRVDLLHMHTPNATMTLALYAAGVRQPLVITHHSDVVKQRFLAKGLAFFERRLLGKAKLILTDSPGYAGGSAQLKPFLEKVEPLALGIDLQPFLEPSAAALHHRDDFRRRYPGPIWVAVGRLVYYKGLATAIDALPTMPGTLLIIGEGPLRRELAERAADAGVAERVVWLGKASADELVGAYQAASALLFPSNARSEGFGLVQVEAMASGCPVINTNIPHSGVSWVSRHDETGLTIDVGSAAQLSAAAARLIDEPGLRTRLAAGAILRAKNHFSAERMASESLDIYGRVLGRSVRSEGSERRPNEAETSAALVQDSSSGFNSAI